MVPLACSQVRSALRSAQADAARGHDRRALALSAGPSAAAAASREVTDGRGASLSAVTQSTSDPATWVGALSGTAPPGRGRPCQPAAVVTATTRTANQAARDRRPRAACPRAACPRACRSRRSGRIDGMLRVRPSRAWPSRAWPSRARPRLAGTRLAGRVFPLPTAGIYWIGPAPGARLAGIIRTNLAGLTMIVISLIDLSRRPARGPGECPCASGKTSRNMAAPPSAAPGRSSRPRRDRPGRSSANAGTPASRTKS